MFICNPVRSLLTLFSDMLLVYNHLRYCNDLFSAFEQQTSILEKLAETTDPTTDRHGHDGPSQTAQSQSGSDFLIRFKGRF